MKKIAYIDLNHPDFYEDYSYVPRRYGGGRIIPGPLMEFHQNFHIFSDKRSFENVRADKLGQCRILDWPARKAIREGAAIKDIIPTASEYDLFFHANTNIHLNLNGLKAEQVIWSVGWSETINPKNKHVMFFDQEFQQPLLYSNDHIIHKIVIGPKVEPFQEYQKEDLIFQCTRHEKCFQSIEVAQLALKHRIKTVFAGPLQHGYPLPNYIDNLTTFYLGEISNTDKVAWNKKAKFNTQFQSWPTPASLSAKESLAYGSAIIALPIGGWPSFIKQGVNGFIINNEQDFLNAWSARDSIQQKNCHATASEYSEDKMIELLQKAFESIIDERLT
jgi:glycosyltransferase involved in cell wall biosynthesis